MSSDLPAFRYHPNPVASGSIRQSPETCVGCDRTTGWIYTATFYTAHEVSGSFCPWCIADGSAAERFAGEFTDSYGLDGVSEEILHEVTRRTPGFHAWQDPRWLVHCHDAAAFIGEVGYSELVAHPRPSISSGKTYAPAAGTTQPNSSSSSPTLAKLLPRCSSAAPSAAPTSPTPTPHNSH
ncbi:CbrC family protein [Streptomyces sp. SGAir0957]